jgi:hypothetical protein
VDSFSEFVGRKTWHVEIDGIIDGKDGRTGNGKSGKS